MFVHTIGNEKKKKKSVNFRYASSDSLRSSTTYYQSNVCTKAHAQRRERIGLCLIDNNS